MKKLLMFLVLLTVSVGTWAASSISTTDGVCTITLDNPSDLGSLTYSETDLAATKVVISCNSTTSFTSEDVAKINQFTSATTLDMSGCNSAVSVSDLNMPNLEYLRLPNSMTSAEDVKAMASMNTNNPNLKMVGAYNGSNSTLPEVALYSFATNEVSKFFTTFADAPMANSKVIRMAGQYGDKDLYVGTSAVFTNNPASWDFTGASFSTIKIHPTVENEYYSVDDPFEDGNKSKPGSKYTTNSFYYFNKYASSVASILLPDQITSLPPQCLYQLGNTNLDNYIALYGQEKADANTSLVSTNGRCLDCLVIPEKIQIVDYECGVRALVKEIQFSKDVKEVRGGAFNTCKDLEELDFQSGITNCRLGDRAFQEAWSMKHIVLSEGITSIGSYCFQNSQQMESIRLPESLVNIGNFAFENNLALGSITIPSGVRKIGKQAFVLCPLTDIYLTTTNPDEVPEIWTAGNDWGDLNSTFGANTMYGNNSIPWNSLPNNWNTWKPGTKNIDENGREVADGTTNRINITWEDAVELYYAHACGMAALHYPVDLADKLLASLSATYNTISSDGFGLPSKCPLGTHTDQTPYNDSNKRASGNNGQRYMGEAGQGIFTSDGWAQFLLMKEFTPDNPVIYTKEYDDVWYTMCFPFDLTDEQLATAFNEGFNIIDFSGVEIKEATEEEPMNLTLHFNSVANTTYKDSDGNIYVRNGNKTTHGKFTYNDYTKVSTGETFKHVQVLTGDAAAGKTKTFAKDGNSDNEIVFIDGILAEAGHPYMVHPNTGTNTGMPLTRCHFSGIKWEDKESWPTLYSTRKRTIDLCGDEPKGNPETGEPDEDNYLQACYTGYEGQTYTFEGNYMQFRNDVTIPAELAMPTVENGKLQALPPVANYTELYPKGPQIPASLEAIYKAVGAKMTEADRPEEVQHPQTYGKYATVKDLLMAERVKYTENNIEYSIKYYEELANSGIDAFFTHYYNWEYVTSSHNANVTEAGLNMFKQYFADVFVDGDYYNYSPEAKFAELQSIATSFAEDMEMYQAYLDDLDAYNANVAAWQEFEEDEDKVAAKNQYEADMSTYLTAVNKWQSDCASVRASNNQKLAQWEVAMNPYRRLIPKGSYFLGRAGRGWPKYYREIADDNRENPTGGFWNQYTAIVRPNDAALNGVEKKLDGRLNNNTKALNMVIDEGFMGTFDPTEIKEIVAEAEEKGQKVEYMNIVYSINGEIVGRGSQSLNNLPQGMYIINGKKYLVK
ncbi:MAG: leucine-rich repeat domain-containing protein [Bacteroidaceae bacterium]|nr:leucine-rich repeat domain-containing protein [Bacteroidaceae bacterium]